MNSDHYQSSGIPHKTIEEIGDIKQWLANQLRQK
jgi:hypothetical protein